MKRTVFFVMFVFMSVGMMISCSSEEKGIFDDSKIYYVIFEENPSLSSQSVFSKNFKIGKILSQELRSNNMVVVKISIQKEYADLMRSNVVFYVSEGKLSYDTVGENGNLIGEESKLLGFTSKTSLYLYVTKHKLGELSGTLINKGEELYKKAIK